MIGSLKIQEKHSFVDPNDEEADKEDYINNGRNDRAAVLNVYLVENNNLSPLVPNHSSILAERSLFQKKTWFVIFPGAKDYKKPNFFPQKLV